ncbi:MAG: hypothetical protein M1824_003196 [Vezdaea acicularis]|nr:MAG: hypothetical protein M1824_003196 [Vezdaea acicularis]
MAYESAPRAAYVEDYNSDTNDTLPETKRQASTKRKSGVQANGDGHSDSGYSSHTAATVNSAESNPEKRYTIPRLNGNNVDQSPKRRPERRPIITSREDTTRQVDPPQRSPQKLSRSASTRNSRKAHQKACEDPHCPDCRPRAERRASQQSPLDRPMDVNYPPFNNYPLGPPSPNSSRRHMAPQYPREAPVAPVPVRPRLIEGSGRPRPTSFHPGSYGEMPAYVGQPYGMEVGPPPSRSAYVNASPFPPPSYPPPGAAVYMVPQPQPQYDMAPVLRPRPQPVHYPTEPYGTSPYGPSSYGYGRPVIEQSIPQPPPQTTHPSAASMARRNSTREAPSERYYEPRDEDYYRNMPPPPIPAKSRPAVHQTTSAREISRPMSVQPNARTIIPERTRSQSQARPSNGRKAASYTVGQNDTSADAYARRRTTVYGDMAAFDMEMEAEAYQEKFTKPAPLTAESLKAAKKSRSRRAPSDTQSQSRSRSSREESEIKAGRSEAESFTMKFAQGANIKLDLKGDMGDRTISFRPNADGEHEVSIESNRSKYIERMSGTASQYEAIEGGRREVREIEDTRQDTRRSREMRTPNRSRRSSKSAYSRAEIANWL